MRDDEGLHRQTIEALIERIYASPEGQLRNALVAMLSAEEGLFAAVAATETGKPATPGPSAWPGGDRGRIRP